MMNGGIRINDTTVVDLEEENKISMKSLMNKNLITLCDEIIAFIYNYFECKEVKK